MLEFIKTLWQLRNLDLQAEEFVKEHGERPTVHFEEMLDDWMRLHPVRRIFSADWAADLQRILLGRYLRGQYDKAQVNALDAAITAAAKALDASLQPAEVGLIRLKIWACLLSLPGAPILPMSRFWGGLAGWLLDFVPGPGRYQDSLADTLPRFEALMQEPDRLGLALIRPYAAGGDTVYDNLRLIAVYPAQPPASPTSQD